MLVKLAREAGILADATNALSIAMASKFECRCGAVIRKNLYEGHGLQLLVPEELTDVVEGETSVDALLDRIVARSTVVATCSQCGLLAVFNEAGDKIRFYAPVGGTS